MTYYEYVMLINENKTSPRNEVLINHLNNFEYEEPVITRLTNHVIDLISARLQNAFDSFVKNILNSNLQIDNLPMFIAELKREIEYVHSFTKTTLLKEQAEALKSQILISVTDFESIIKSSLANTNNNEIESIINNLDLKEGIL